MRLHYNERMSQPAKEKLKDAFELYLSEEGHTLDSLTIKHFSSLASIHRVTFYQNFESMMDFIKWYLHKDLIFKINKDQPVLLEESLTAVFTFVFKHREILKKIFSSCYNQAAKDFIFQETLNYQLFNFSRIDTHHLIAESIRLVYARIFSAGICQLIMDSIELESYSSYSIKDLNHFGMMLFKNYIESIVNSIPS